MFVSESEIFWQNLLSVAAFAGFIMAFVGLINPLLAAIIHVSSELVFMVNSSRLVIDSDRSNSRGIKT